MTLSDYFPQIIVIGITIAIVVVFGIMINRSAKKHIEKKKESKHRKYQR
jgi:FtsZ-interacting cell division protein ZipA